MENYYGTAALLLPIGILIATKPGYRSFKDMVYGTFRKALHKVPSGFKCLSSSFEKDLKTQLKMEVSDYLLFSIGKWEEAKDGGWVVYLGVLNSWWSLDSSANYQ